MLPLQILCNTSRALLSRRPNLTYFTYKMCHTLSCAHPHVSPGFVQVFRELGCNPAAPVWA